MLTSRGAINKEFSRSVSQATNPIVRFQEIEDELRWVPLLALDEKVCTDVFGVQVANDGRKWTP